MSHHNLSLAQSVAMAVVYSLSSSSRAKHPDADKHFADLALKLIAMQPRSRE
jgi:hypothetical protein